MAHGYGRSPRACMWWTPRVIELLIGTGTVYTCAILQVNCNDTTDVREWRVCAPVRGVVPPPTPPPKDQQVPSFGIIGITHFTRWVISVPGCYERHLNQVTFAYERLCWLYVTRRYNIHTDRVTTDSVEQFH